MLSILIPTYNYNVVTLVDQIVKQSDDSGIEYEVIIMDDASTDTIISEENKLELDKKEQVTYIISKKNRGREKTRQKLAKNAKYHWLLFLDADTTPKENDFIARYLKAIDEEAKLIFGGVSYQEKAPDRNEILRWNYGRAREDISVQNRNNNKYLTINSGGFIVDKSTFIDINSQITWGNYGLDILFTHKLMENEIPVKHINNPVIHLGLETNQEYLVKSKKAVETLFFLQEKRLISINYSSLQKTYNRLKKYRLVGMFRLIISRFIPLIEKKLISKKTSLYLFDIYRLYYYSDLTSKSFA